MTHLIVPAGAAVRFSAQARADFGVHRWTIAVLPSAGGPARVNFASKIGERDLHQRVDIPAQDVECRLQIDVTHETSHGWEPDRVARQDDTPDGLLIGFCDPSRNGARPDDVLLHFAFETRGETAPNRAPVHQVGSDDHPSL